MGGENILDGMFAEAIAGGAPVEDAPAPVEGAVEDAAEEGAPETVAPPDPAPETVVPLEPTPTPTPDPFRSWEGSGGWGYVQQTEGGDIIPTQDGSKKPAVLPGTPQYDAIVQEWADLQAPAVEGSREFYDQQMRQAARLRQEALNPNLTPNERRRYAVESAELISAASEPFRVGPTRGDALRGRHARSWGASFLGPQRGSNMDKLVRAVVGARAGLYGEGEFAELETTRQLALPRAYPEGAADLPLDAAGQGAPRERLLGTGDFFVEEDVVDLAVPFGDLLIDRESLRPRQEQLRSRLAEEEASLAAMEAQEPWPAGTRDSVAVAATEDRIAEMRALSNRLDVAYEAATERSPLSIPRLTHYIAALKANLAMVEAEAWIEQRSAPPMSRTRRDADEGDTILGLEPTPPGPATRAMHQRTRDLATAEQTLERMKRNAVQLGITQAQIAAATREYAAELRRRGRSIPEGVESEREESQTAAD